MATMNVRMISSGDSAFGSFRLKFRCKQSQPAEGLLLAEESLRIATKHGLIALARQIEPIVDQIRALLK